MNKEELKEKQKYLDLISHYKFEKTDEDEEFLYYLEELLPEEVDTDYLEPLFSLLGNNPDINFGSPGNIVHYLEKFEEDIYIPLLYKTLDEHPTQHLVWMLNRYLNAVEGEKWEEGIICLRKLSARSEVNSPLKEVVDHFLAYQTEEQLN